MLNETKVIRSEKYSKIQNIFLGLLIYVSPFSAHSRPNKSNKEPFGQFPEANWTVDDWKKITKKWSLESKLLTQFARDRTYEERTQRGAEMLEKRDETSDPKYGEFLSTIWSLPDEIMDKIIASFKD
ncbi:hypothetical protein A2767_04750 [Candidatus Roizmanbacteria bacterium RIFCSPHIGHO2_01_FULL_35_10]|uniref:Uncharacterized protein n=1 Tax=Candidatus Roizmanbacteria bacterium RIFCSPLOWO2_01_FULL_35_13 TaxID=1802055 RepID=A0A1F7I727_9BACT|nr:MAG: hypothetical protein A2767_04750 [Candidatus Roizmanbacteria bacterium RIFCSPHIGHO2_01_FULL_35_10]OGK39143.1 MAG: hypothetical protein A3A74_03545 [Candidatus Roizmanbacteria bacterium RIFCSPLOWO2_01_FULL_35_13]